MAYICLYRYHEWLNYHKPKIISKSHFLMENLLYDVKADPLHYLHGMVHICASLVPFKSYHQAVPLRTSMSPRYVTMDTTALIALLMDRG